MATREPVREFFDSVQEAAESGGRQHDAQGKPLVGRYRNGTTPPPEKRAYGAGQMQIATAKAVAAKHGVAWDENKFLNDKNYNLNLADQHMKDLIVKYRDRTLARGAYHSGEGAVDRAIQKYGREGFAQGLGPEGRKYVQMGQNRGASGGYNASQPGQGVADPAKFLEGLESSLGPETRSSSNVTQRADKIFGSDKELALRSNDVQAQLETQGAQLDVLGQAMQVAQAGAREAMQEQVNHTRDISNEIVAGTNELKQKVIPIFKARGRVADQLDKLNTMNPLERGLRGIFDMNYDKDHLESQLDNFDRTLKARADDFQYLNQLHGVALQEVERRYKLDTALPSLIADQAKEDLGLTSMRIQQTAGMLGNLKDSISTQSQMIAAKAGAREDLLTRLDLPTVTDLMTKAQESGGMVQFNGVEFSYKELRDRIQAGEQQELQMESYRMAIAGGRMDMANKYAENLARSLTRPQIESAIQNGGVYNGVQLPQDTLAQMYQNSLQRDTLRAEEVSRQMPAKLALDTAQSYMAQTTGLHQRSRGLFGAQAMDGSQPYLERGGQLVRRLIDATNKNEPPEVITALTAEVAKNSAEYQKFVDDRILRQVGGDKRAAGYMKGFVYGSQLSPGTAAEALTYFAMKGNLPEGVSLSPETKQVFQKAQQIVQSHRQDKVNGKAITEPQLQALVTRELTTTANQIMGQARHDKLYGDLPTVAGKVGHGFGKFPAERWAQIRAEASMSAAESIAHTVNTTPQNVLRMLRTGKPLADDQNSKNLFAKVKENAGAFNGVEMATTVRLMDMEPQVQKGRRNSSVMSDFIGSPQFSTGLSSYGQALGSNSMGEYLANPLVQGATERNFINTRQGVLDAQAQVHQQQRQLAQNPTTNLLMKPVARTQMILQSIPGLGKEGAEALTPFAKDFFAKYTKERGIEPAFGTANDMFVAEDNALYSALQTTKFQDPRMEVYRKQAVKSWKEHATPQQSTISRILEYATGTISSLTSQN